jgi:hypothetical protein
MQRLQLWGKGQQKTTRMGAFPRDSGRDLPGGGAEADLSLNLGRSRRCLSSSWWGASQLKLVGSLCPQVVPYPVQRPWPEDGRVSA